MLNRVLLCCLILTLVSAASEASVIGIKHTNVLGGPEEHASFSFVRPGLTQTSFAFHGPSSHQTFSSTVGNPHLIHKVQPNVAHALRYRNPGLGYFPTAPIPTSAVYSGGVPAQPLLSPYQFSQDPAIITYPQQAQQQFPLQVNTQFDSNIYQAQLLKHLALKQTQLQNHQIPEQIQLQQQEPPRNLLGVGYSDAPSVSRVKFSGNDYKFDF